jgi:hypothetical protein
MSPRRPCQKSPRNQFCRCSDDNKLWQSRLRHPERRRGALEGQVTAGSIYAARRQIDDGVNLGMDVPRALITMNEQSTSSKKSGVRFFRSRTKRRHYDRTGAHDWPGSYAPFILAKAWNNSGAPHRWAYPVSHGNGDAVDASMAGVKGGWKDQIDRRAGRQIEGVRAWAVVLLTTPMLCQHIRLIRDRSRRWNVATK